MTTGNNIHIEGGDDLDRQLAELERALKPSEVEPILLDGAKTVANAAKPLAPVGPTGNLRKSLRAKLLARRATALGALGVTEGYAAPAIAAVDRRKAPHSHLVEFGTGERIGGPRSVRYGGRSFGKMPSKPFLRPAWESTRTMVLQTIIARFKELLDNAVR